MKKLTYILKFNITNLDKSELREMKIDLLDSNNVMEFESESMPRIPSIGEIIIITGRKFKVTGSNSQYVINEDSLNNLITISIVDKDKQDKKDSDDYDKKIKEESLYKKAIVDTPYTYKNYKSGYTYSGLSGSLGNSQLKTDGLGSRYWEEKLGDYYNEMIKGGKWGRP